MPKGSKNWPKISSLGYFWPLKSMKSPSRFSDVEKVAPGTKNDEIFIPSDPQNHQTTTVKHSISWKSRFSFRAALRIEKTPKMSPTLPQNGARNCPKQQKLKTNNAKIYVDFVFIFWSFWLHFSSIFGGKLPPRESLFSSFSPLGAKRDPKGGQGTQMERKGEPKGPKRGWKVIKKGGQDTKMNPKDVTKVVTKVKHGGGTGVSHWIYIYIYIYIPRFKKWVHISIYIYIYIFIYLYISR